jgi:hypothetical protein
MLSKRDFLRIEVVLSKRDFLRIEVVLLLLAGVAAGFAFSLLFDACTRGVGATLLGVLVVAVGTFRTIQVTREGQVTDRFSNAIGQLGSKVEEIRLGGIYALERIARDSRRDHDTVMEVLTAYVRKHAPWPPKSDASGHAKSPPPENDVQAVLAVLGRRKVSHDVHDLDLKSTDLRGALFGEAKLKRVIFKDAHLEGAHLAGADLAGANLAGASYDEGTQWPDGFKPAGFNPDAKGVQRVAGQNGE